MFPIVMKIDFDEADLPTFTGICKPRDEDKSPLKVVAKLFRVGGMRVSPSVFVVCSYFASMMIDFSCFREKVPFAADGTKGTVGTPSHLAASFGSAGSLTLGTVNSQLPSGSKRLAVVIASENHMIKDFLGNLSDNKTSHLGNL
jgi:hypothetical protein